MWNNLVSAFYFFADTTKINTNILVFSFQKVRKTTSIWAPRGASVFWNSFAYFA